MFAIHITQQLNSDTLHLPELRPLIGKTVEITVREAGSPIAGTDPWQALAELSGKDLVDDQVVEGYREFDRRNWQPG
jgi:hypothetical protein